MSLIETNEHMIDTPFNTNMFTVTNIGLWFFWAVLIGLLLLLFAVRRNIAQLTTSSEPQTAHRSEANQKSDKATKIQYKQSVQKQALVKPAKIVKIKVRKIKRRNNTV